MNFNKVTIYIIGYIVLAVVVFFAANYFLGFFTELGNKINGKDVPDSFLNADFKILAALALLTPLILLLKASKK